MSERLQARSLLNGREGELPKVLGVEESFYIQIQRREGDGDTQHVAIGAGAVARGVRDRVRATTTGRAPRCGYTPFARAVRRESTSARFPLRITFFSSPYLGYDVSVSGRF